MAGQVGGRRCVVGALVGFSLLAGACLGSPTAPPPVTGLGAAASVSSVSLSWTNPSSGFWGVRVYRAEGATPPAGPGPGEGPGSYLADVGDRSSFVDTGLGAGTTYSYAVIVYGADGYYSPAVTVTTTTVGAALAAPGDTSSIALVSTSTADGWTFDYYRNSAYPCAISGYQTFVVGRKVGSSPTSPAPLWAYMRGGGAGYFAETGAPVGGTARKVEDTAASLQARLTGAGLISRIRDDAAGFRTLSVSYCGHEAYGGTNSYDPHNPNLDANGLPRTTNGTYATKAAIQFVQALYPTTKTFLHGTSAGSVGAFWVAWSMQLQGIPPAGVVADAAIVNTEGANAAFAAGYCTDENDPNRVAAIAARINPDLASPDNAVDRLVTTGRLTVPLVHLWNHADSNTCGSPPISCPLRDGTTVTLGLTDCLHEPLRLAIEADGPSSRSVNLGVCVDADPTPDCSQHVVTTANLTNTDPSAPGDYLGAIVDWVDLRLTDAP